MIRQAPLRGVATLLLAALLSSCGETRRPVVPTTSSSIPRSIAGRTDLVPVGDVFAVDGQAVVVLNPSATLSGFLNRYQLSELQTVVIDQTEYLLVQSAGIKAADLVGLLGRDLEVASVDYNYALQAPEYEGTPMSFDDQNGTLTSAEYGEQEQLDRIHIHEALAITGGAGTRIAILDTGIDAGHPGWAGMRIVMGKDFSVRPPGPRADETADDDDFDHDGQTHEAFGHGTHVAGIARLVAPQSTLIPIRVLNDDGWGTTVGLASGILQAVAMQADVINMSLGLTRDVPMVRHAVEHAMSRKIGLVASAGNNATRDEQYPANYPGVFSVTAVDDDDRLAPFAGRGPSVDVSAPGTRVISLFARGPGRGLYASGSGTSMAAPFLAGAAALFKSVQPGFDGSLAAEVVVNSSTPIDDLNPTVVGQIGRGRVDLRSALGDNAPPEELPIYPRPSPSPGGFPHIKPKF
jgi:subtilisin family serine protease